MIGDVFVNTRRSDLYVEYSFEAGLAHPINLAGNLLSAELFVRYHEPFVNSRIRSKGFLPGFSLIYSY